MANIFLQRIRTTAFALLLIAALTGCHCANRVNPYNQVSDLAVLNNAESPYQVQVWSKKNTNFIGEILELEMRSSAAGYLSLYGISSSGKIYRLFENQMTAAGQTVVFPGQQLDFQFRVSPPTGNEVYILCSTTRKLQWLAPGDIYQNGRLTVLSMDRKQFLSRLSTALHRHHPKEWDTGLVELTIAAQ